jgi:hypothetical protein
MGRWYGDVAERAGDRTLGVLARRIEVSGRENGWAENRRMGIAGAERHVYGVFGGEWCFGMGEGVIVRENGL